MTQRILGNDRLRLLSKTDTTKGALECWPFMGAKNSCGYGNFWLDGKYLGAHRAMYLLFMGPIMGDLEVDHLCHDGRVCPGGFTCPHRLCVNPIHLALATHRDNDLRGAGQSALAILRQQCPQGHPYDEANTYRRPDTPEGHSSRDCRKCRAAAEARRRARARLKAQ